MRKGRAEGEHVEESGKHGLEVVGEGKEEGGEGENTKLPQFGRKQGILFTVEVSFVASSSRV